MSNFVIQLQNQAMHVFSDRFKRSTSLLLIFSILFGQTVQFSFVETSSAADTLHPNLVSIIVPESLNSGDVGKKLKLYASDIQANLPGSRAVIFEIPNNLTPEKIAALEEKLFYEGDGNGISRLVGTVLVGDIPLPVVHKGEKSFLSVYPYTDFENKAFTYKTDKGYYEYSDGANVSDVPEIWHGVIRPNTGDAIIDRAQIAQFLDKTHNAYSKTGIYSAENTLADPYVFYYDGYHDKLASKLVDWKAYRLGEENMEDIIYNRFSKYFAAKLATAYQKITDSTEIVTNPELQALMGSGSASLTDFSGVPDIQTREAVKQMAKSFYQVLNDSYIGNILRFGYNTGRYGTAKNVHLDTPAVLITKQDGLSKQITKDTNTSIEQAINTLIQNGLARKIPIAASYSEATMSAAAVNGSSNTPSTVATASTGAYSYTAYYYGLTATGLTEAQDCTIARGSSLLVEENRAYNVNNSFPEADFLKSDMSNAACFPSGIPATMAYWGGNSPLNLTQDSKGTLSIKSHKYTTFSKPVFDMAGSREITNGSSITVPSPLDCYREDFLRNPYKAPPLPSSGDSAWVAAAAWAAFQEKSFPLETDWERYSCLTIHQTRTGMGKFEEHFLDTTLNKDCTERNLILDGVTVYKSDYFCPASTTYSSNGVPSSEPEGTSKTRKPKIITLQGYHAISSVMKHTSPTDAEYAAALKNVSTPSLAIDRDRYVDFMSAKGNYTKITYPNFFRLQWNDSEELTKEQVAAKIKEVLDAKSLEINKVIVSENPATLDGTGQTLYNILKSGEYPAQANVDLYASVASDPKTFEALVNAVLWNNLSNATAKYSYILEHNLDRDGNSLFGTAASRSDYEIAYIGGRGDTRNLYVKMDPEAKAELSADLKSIQSRSQSLTSSLSAANVSGVGGGKTDSKDSFVCGPPEGVPIWEWVPAIFCWVKEIQKVGIEPGNCSTSTLGAANDKTRAEYDAKDSNGNGISDWMEDFDKNGIIDGYELVRDGKLELKANAPKIGLNNSATLTATLYDSKNNRIVVDSQSEVHLDIASIKSLANPSAPKLVYARSASGSALGDSTTIATYLNFPATGIGIRAKDGAASFAFSSKNTEADITFDAKIVGRTQLGRTIFEKSSELFTLKIRDEALQVSALKPDGSVIDAHTTAGDLSSITFNIEKLAKGKKINPTFPITLRITNEDGIEQGEPITLGSARYTYNGPLLSRAGSYEFEFIEGLRNNPTGLANKQTIDIIPAPASEIKVLPASNFFVAREKDTIMVQILDRFGNVVKGNALSLRSTISGGGFFSENNDSTLVKTIVDGYAKLDVSSNDANGVLTFQTSIDGTSLKSSPVQLKSVGNAKIAVEVSNSWSIVAGKEGHDIAITVLGADGKKLDGYSGIASVSFPKLSGTLSSEFTKIENGVSTTPLVLSPAYAAGKNLALDIRIPGITDISGNRVTILPDVPMRVELSAEQSMIEARSDSSEMIEARLYDRYGNLAYVGTDGSRADFKIPDEYRKYLRFDNASNIAQAAFSGGVATVPVHATKFPGTPYVTVSVDPKLEKNGFTVTDKNGGSLTISGVSDALIAIDTAYYWNGSKIANMDYNALYTVLIGAGYGNVAEPGYLGGELLFRPNSRSVAVTSLLADGLTRSSPLSLTPGGKVTIAEDSVLQAEFVSDATHPYFAFYDPYRREYLTKVFPNFSGTTSLQSCASDDQEGIANCSVPTDGSYAIVKGYGDAQAIKSGGIALIKNGVRAFELSGEGRITLAAGVTLEIDRKNTLNLFAAKIVSGNITLGYFAMKFRSEQIILASENNLNSTLDANRGSLVVQPISSNFTHERTYLGNSSRGARGIAFYDSRETDNIAADRDMIGGPDKVGFEEYYEDESGGIGWQGANKTLLEFAGGANVGEATKYNMSFNTINLGDPVLKLAAKVSGKSFDQTIGKRITSGEGDIIESYRKIDYNKDGLDDLVVFFQSGKIKLFGNISGTLKDMGYLAYAADAGSNRKWVGDFEGDGYGDIAFTTDKWALAILVNHESKFTRIAPPIKKEDGSPGKITGKITELSVFDMNADGLSDIIYTDDAGELAILYGTMTGGNLSFRKKILDTTLGLRISTATRSDGGAVRYNGMVTPKPVTQADYLAQSQELANWTGTGIPSDTAALAADAKIYIALKYQEAVDENVTAADAVANSNVVMSDPDATGTGANDDYADGLEPLGLAVTHVSSRERSATFIRSEYAEAKGIKVIKAYSIENGDILKSDSRVKVQILLENTSGKTLIGVLYADSNEAKLFRLEDPSYRIRKGSNTGSGFVATSTETGSIQSTETEAYDLSFDPIRLEKWQTAEISYSLGANSVGFGTFAAGRLDATDVYGDVAMATSETCGANATVWQSTDKESYRKAAQNITDTAKLPAEFEKLKLDKNANGISDEFDELASTGATGKANYASWALADYVSDKTGNGIPDYGDPLSSSSLVTYDANSRILDIGNEATMDEINGKIDEVVAGLGCGFGGGSCISTPLNYAPLAPGSSPTIMGYPASTELLNPGVGLPIFAAPTQSCTTFGIPVWPPCPYGAGGWLDGNIYGRGMSQFRLFVTPTVTGSAGIAVCYGSNSQSLVKWPKWQSPVTPGGNCIVAAKPLSSCSGDGSDGDFTSSSVFAGMSVSPNGSDTSGFYNANSCSVNGSGSVKTTLSETERQTVIDYARGDSSKLTSASSILGSTKSVNLSAGPIVGIGGSSGEDPNFEVGIDSTALKNFDLGSVLKIKNSRVSGFPDFFMEWVTRQVEEVINKLTSLPTLIIILPDFKNVWEGGWKDFAGKLQSAMANGKSSYKDKNFSAGSSGTAGFSQAKSVANKMLSNNQTTLNTAGRNISGLKAAYEFMSRLPILQFENSSINITVPIISEEGVLKFQKEITGTMDQWKNEIETTKAAWAKAGTAAGINEQLSVNAGGLIGSLQSNLRTLDSYARFPEKLQKYLRWKERYAEQLLCNVETMEQVMGGWISDNGKRFRSWVELYVLIKAILKSWQSIIDLFKTYKESCGTCRNERYDLKYFIFKLISAVIPKIPIIQFPAWPDIILDVHNIRLGIHILMPEFNFTFVPITFPHLPRLSLPKVPTASIGLPSIPLLPALPDLPELPDLPSLPKVKLPDLPPPPTIPKIMSGISGVLSILKVVTKVLCLMKISPFVPEWRAGDQIAQLTERSTTLPIDFINVEFPNFPVSYLKALKVSAFVNLEFQADFILEMAKATLAPLGKISNDLSNMPSAISSVKIPGVDLGWTVPDNINIDVTDPSKIQGMLPEAEQKIAMRVAASLASAIIYFTADLESRKSDMTDVTGLRTLLAEESKKIAGLAGNPKEFSIANTLSEAVAYNGATEDALTDSLHAENAEKFALVKSTIRSELSDTQILREEFRTFFQTGENSKEIPGRIDSLDSIKKVGAVLAINSSDATKQANKQLSVYENRAVDAFASLVNPSATSSYDTDLKTEGNTVIRRLQAMRDSGNTVSMLDNGTPYSETAAAEFANLAAAADSNNSASNGLAYSYSYVGIYTIDHGSKRRLFNYTDEISGDEEVVRVNRLKSEGGKEDVIYRMGNDLFIKQNLEWNTLAPNTDDIETLAFDDVMADRETTPAAPNFFEESIASPNTINFSFNPAKKTQGKFHLEFYDYINRFDRIRSGELPSEITPTTTARSIDLFTTEEEAGSVGLSYEGVSVGNNAVILSRARWSGKITIPKYRTISAGESVNVGEGRTLRSSAESARLKYKLSDTAEWKMVSIPKWGKATFSSNAEVNVIDGSALLFEDSFTETPMEDLGDLQGFPLVAGSKISLDRKNAFIELEYADGSTYRVDGPATYEVVSLGANADNYTVSIDAANAYYYSELSAFDGLGKHTLAGLTLLSPQVAADDTGPLISFPNEFKIPVYSNQTIDMTDYLSDISWVKNFRVDTDSSTDSDGDGQKDNDPDSLRPGSGIANGANPMDLQLGSFNSLWSHEATLFAEDNNGNISKKSIKITVYAPIPSISWSASGTVNGTINEKTQWEPIDLMRYRSGRIDSVTQGGSLYTDGDGLFNGSFATPSWLMVKNASGTTIANIDERTGVIRPLASGMTFEVLWASLTNPTTIVLKDASGKIVYRESLALPPNSTIDRVSKLGDITKNGAFVVIPDTTFSFVRNTPESASLPNGGYILNTSSKKAIAGIGSDGNVYLLDTSYRLAYKSDNGRIILSLVDSANKTVADIAYSLEAEFILR